MKGEPSTRGRWAQLPPLKIASGPDVSFPRVCFLFNFLSFLILLLSRSLAVSLSRVSLCLLCSASDANTDTLSVGVQLWHRTKGTRLVLSHEHHLADQHVPWTRQKTAKTSHMLPRSCSCDFRMGENCSEDGILHSPFSGLTDILCLRVSTLFESTSQSLGSAKPSALLCQVCCTD